ncbi:MAG: dihydrolipoyl dehydrogenase [Lachnospiraceae bacterium]|nr:dihydrolipoyl dehydrogenase [Lachnospiraceae bacterium]
MSEVYDLIVIGGGPGGYEAAAFAAHSGMKTALVEKDALGGTCLNRGCIPTKTLLHSAEFYGTLAGEKTPAGVTAEGLRFDLAAMQDRKDAVVTQLREGVAATLKKAKVTVYQGTGTVLGSGLVRVQGESAEELSAKHILIATGSVPVRLPLPGAEGDAVYDSDGLLSLRKPLSSLTVIGGGVIGLEFASLYLALGAKVTVIEALDRLIANMDKELGVSIRQLLKKRGAEIITGASLQRIEDAGGLKRAVYLAGEAEQSVDAEAVLIAVGRRAYTEGLFAEGVAVQTERGRIVTDEYHRTNLDGVYAIGDVSSGIQLAHAATAAGINAVCHMLGKEPLRNESLIPSCVYTDPEIASVGMTKEEATAAGLAVVSKKYPMSANGKTVLSEGERGFIKIISEEGSGRILGAQMMCARATDMIAHLATAVNAGLTVEQMRKTVFPHPTFSEGISEALSSI